MKTDLHLNLSPAALLTLLNRAKPYLIGITLIAAFGGAAYAANSALNAQPAATASSQSVINFNKSSHTNRQKP